MLNGSSRAFGAVAALLLTAPLHANAARDGLAPPQERVTHDQFEAMVVGPRARLDAGDIAGAEAAFEALLARETARRGARGAHVADYLTAFGLALFGHYTRLELQPEMRRRSLAYFRRAIPAYREAFGPDHPEVALAVNTYADAALVVVPDDPPRDLEAALEDGYRIRVAERGADSIGAAATLVRLARVRGAPSRVREDPQALTAAAEISRRAVAAFERAPKDPDDDRTIFVAYFGLAEVYARNGRLAEALATAEVAGAHHQRAFAQDEDMCRSLGIETMRFSEFLRARGHSQEEEALRARFDALGYCYGIVIPPLDLPGAA